MCLVDAELFRHYLVEESCGALNSGAMPYPESFEDIVCRFRDRIYNQAYRMLGNREDAEGAAQDVFLRIHRSLGSFRGESAVSTWVFRITVNVCMNRFRKKQLRFESIEGKAGEEGQPIENTISDDRADPFEISSANQVAELVREQVRALPPATPVATRGFCEIDGL